MDSLLGIDWVDYFHHLSDDDLSELATWLAAESLMVSEFMEFVDRVYTHESVEWHGRTLAFVACCGRPAAQEYARRKRRLAELMIALEAAEMSGALRGDVVLEALRPLPQPQTPPRNAEELRSILVRTRSAPR